MLCLRCALRNTKKGIDICSVCQINLMVEDVPNIVKDSEIIDWYVLKAIEQGCRYCSSHKFGIEAGINYENELKWYILKIDCKDCNKKYEEIVEVRTNESKRDELKKGNNNSRKNRH